MKKIFIVIMTVAIIAAFAGCGRKEEAKTEITVLAAASLTDVCDELKTAFEEENEGVTVTFSFGGSGALQAQIEEGAPADMFISAATKQMEELKAQGLMDEDSITELLENKVVLIVPEGNPAGINSFEEVTKAALIGLGETASVPVGQYSEEIFTSLGIWEQVKAKANFGSDVRTVLSWVEAGAVDCGVVYATDAMTGENTETVCSAPADTHKPVIYPAGIIKASEKKEAARAFMEFLEGDDAAELFEKYGFTVL